jgi:hypothetical protein
MKLELKAFTWPTIFTSTNSFYPVFYHLQSCINRETALECRYMNVMTIVSVCGSLRGAKGAVVRFLLHQKSYLGSIWLITLMSHMDPYNGRYLWI